LISKYLLNKQAIRKKGKREVRKEEETELEMRNEQLGRKRKKEKEMGN
jgi:hypothetical protein